MVYAGYYISVSMRTQLEDVHESCRQHPKRRIVLVCLSEGCQKTRLCCLECVDEGHCKHEVVSLRRFEQKMKEHLQENNKNPQKGKISKLFMDAETTLLKHLLNFEATFTTKIQQLEQKIHLIFTQIHTSFTVPSHDHLIHGLTQNFNSEQFDELLKKIRVCCEFRVGSAKDTSKIIEHEIDSFKKKVVECTNELQNKFALLEEELKKMTFCSKRAEDQPYFHPVHKYHDLTIQDLPSVVEKKKNSGTRNLALGNYPLNPVNNKVSFEILSNGDGIPSLALGVCILSVVKASNYSNCIGFRKGVYAIDQSSSSNWGGLQESNVAFSWHHDLQSKNNIPTPIFFTNGDRVEVEIDFGSGDIIFSLEYEEGEVQIFVMPIDTSHRDLYPFVALSNSGALVRILQ